MLSPHHTRYRTTHRLTQLLCVVLLFIHGVASGKEITIKPIQTFPHNRGVLSVAFSPDPDGKHVLTGSEDKTAVLWNRQGKKIQTFPHNSWVGSVAFSPDGKHILTGSGYSNAVLWDRQGKKIRPFSHSHWVLSVAFSPDGKHILTGSYDKTAALWDRQGKKIQTFPHNDSVKSVAFFPDGKYILTWSEDNTAVLWDRQGEKIHTFKHNGTVWSVTFSHDGKYILTGAYKVALLWDSQGKKIQTFPHNDSVKSVAFSPDGKHILTGSDDNTAVLWDRQGEKIQTFPHNYNVWSVAFSPDGKHILTGSEDGHARLFAIPQPYVFPKKTTKDTGLLTIEEVATMAKFGVQIRYDDEDNVHAIDPSDSPEKVITAVELLLRDLHLDRLPPWLGKFTQLTHLDVSDNQLQLDDLALLRGFNQLENLNLANNPVFNKFIGTGGLFEHLPKVRILNLRNTGFENSELAGLSPLRGLLELDVSSNAISALSLPKLTQLQTLLANNNHISQITLAEEVRQLTHLELNNNRLDTLDLNALPDGIISIKAQSNNMKKLQFDSERDKRALEVLDLKNNNKLILPDSMGGAFVLQRLTRLGRDDSVRLPGILERKLPKAN